MRNTVAFLFLLIAANAAPALANDSYDATVDRLFHGFLEVMDTHCHGHSLTFADAGVAGVSRVAFDAWAAEHYNVHIVSRTQGDLEYAIEIYPREGGNAIRKYASEEQSFGAHVDGRIVSSSQGNALGSFTLQTQTGATRDFGFLAGREPLVNGHSVYCLNGPDPIDGCDTLLKYVRFGKTRVRVFYKVVDGPDAARDEVIKILTL